MLAAPGTLPAQAKPVEKAAPKPGEKPAEKPTEKMTPKPEEKPTTPPTTPAPEAVKIEEEKLGFNSADGVELQGRLYKSVKGGGSSSVILLHSVGKDPNNGDWHGLATTLATEGFNVLRFDFRGHGRSTQFDKVFWNPDYINAHAFPALFKKKPLPEKIEMKDVQNAKGYYLPTLANDVMAARIALDKLNDSGQTNTGSTYLIGSTDAAGIGLFYMVAEWTRPQTVAQAHNPTTYPPRPWEVPVNADFAGKDIVGAIWLSPMLPRGIEPSVMRKWISPTGLGFTGLRDKNAIYCLYGADDAAGKAVSNTIVNEVFEAKAKDRTKNPLAFTKMEAIPNTKAVGVDLLGKQLGTEDKILKYLKSLEDDRKKVITVNRNYTKPGILIPSAFGVK